MKCLITSVFLAFALLNAQDASVSRTTSVDINGHRIADGPDVVKTKSPNGTTTTERLQSINGRSVPVERVEERVIRDDASGRVVERVIRSFDRDGNPTPPTKETIEEHKRPDGGSTKQTTTYRTDINGNMQLLRKSTADTRTSGSSQTTDTVVQQPTVNGSLETVEKRSTVKVKDVGDDYREDSTTFRRDANGNFAEAVRTSTAHSQQGPDATDNTAEFEVGSDGRMHLHGQTVTKTTTRSDGSADVQKDIFGQNVPGTVDTAATKMRLQERQVIERKPGPGDSVVETVQVRRPTVSDPNVLGPAKQLSQTICRGKCDQ